MTIEKDREEIRKLKRLNKESDIDREGEIRTLLGLRVGEWKRVSGENSFTFDMPEFEKVLDDMRLTGIASISPGEGPSGDDAIEDQVPVGVREITMVKIEEADLSLLRHHFRVRGFEMFESKDLEES